MDLSTFENSCYLVKRVRSSSTRVDTAFELSSLKGLKSRHPFLLDLPSSLSARTGSYNYPHERIVASATNAQLNC